MRELFRIVHAADLQAAIRRAGQAMLSVAAVSVLAGCAMPIALPGMSLDDQPTGTIKLVDTSPFSPEMDAEDWRRARSALETALDPQGNGAKVAWDNPQSGAKGAFTPSAQPYPKDDGICRAFTASVELQGHGARTLKSSACRRNGGEWIVGKVLALEITAQPRKTAAMPGQKLAEGDIPTHLN